MAARDGSTGSEPTFKEIKDDLRREGQRLTADMKEDARRFAQDRQAAAAGLLTDVGGAASVAAEEMRRRGRERVADYTGYAARQVEHLAEELSHRELGEVMDEIEDFARRRPALFFGATFLAGFAAMRFLKSRGNGAS